MASDPGSLDILRRWCAARSLHMTVGIQAARVTRSGRRDIRTATVLRARVEVVMLWAVALEIDERQVTLTGERVCRWCGGRGEVIADIEEKTVDMNSCPCNGPTRPTDVSLHRMIALMATLGEPPYGDLPELWAVDVDAMEAAGWRDVVLPSTRARGRVDVTPAWMCSWWRAFREWTLGGEGPNGGDLERIIAALLPELEARERRKLWRRLVEVTVDPAAARPPFPVSHGQRLRSTTTPTPQSPFDALVSDDARIEVSRLANIFGVPHADMVRAIQAATDARGARGLPALRDVGDDLLAGVPWSSLDFVRRVLGDD